LPAAATGTGTCTPDNAFLIFDFVGSATASGGAERWHRRPRMMEGLTKVAGVAVQVDPSQADAPLAPFAPFLPYRTRAGSKTLALFPTTLFPAQLASKPRTAAAVMAYNNQYQQHDDHYNNNNNNNNWDTRSAKSYNTQHSNYSAQHLNPQYNNAPPVPQLHYAQPAIDYPPMQQPGMFNRDPSIPTGYTSARDKLMNRRVSTRTILTTGRLAEMSSTASRPHHFSMCIVTQYRC
jgi:hypothetical protein